MDTIQAYYNGSVFIPLAPVKAKLNQPALITILESINTKADNNRCSEFFGALSIESYQEILDALKDTERVDVNEW
ncbi:MAG: hypothetical protein LBD23_15870 [Oscillospiraceae bacterium]|jgi:hypothetical protein|nr:hypothetical protein [Oscillospiraceae bacterium]